MSYASPSSSYINNVSGYGYEQEFDLRTVVPHAPHRSMKSHKKSSPYSYAPYAMHAPATHRVAYHDTVAPILDNEATTSCCQMASYLPQEMTAMKGWAQSYPHFAPPPSYPETPAYHHPYSQTYATPQLPLHEHAKPTRMGYWNRRGDTILPSGHLLRASGLEGAELYPEDLRTYPTHALMNEMGNVVLPVTSVERVILWQALVEEAV